MTPEKFVLENKTQIEEWDPKKANLSAEEVLKRIKSCISYRGWLHVTQLIKGKNSTFTGLKIAEVGAGTGIFSLTLGLLGASVTLIDFNQKALDNAKKIYQLCGCAASFTKADCLKEPPLSLLTAFDFVISGGLAEHFSGQDRKRCINFHKNILKEGGFAFIGVPNRYSLPYQGIRLFRRLTRTWKISVEIPYSNLELKRIARESGFKNFYVLGNASLLREFFVYTRGFISAVIDILPQRLKANIRKIKRCRSEQLSDRSIQALAKKTIEERINRTSSLNKRISGFRLTDQFSAGLILFAFK